MPSPSPPSSLLLRPSSLYSTLIATWCNANLSLSSTTSPPPRSRVRKTNSIPQSHNWHHSRRKYAATRHPTGLIWKRASYWGGDQKAPWAAVQKGLRNSSCFFIQCRGCQRLQQRGTILSSYVLSPNIHTTLFSFLVPNFSNSKIFGVWSPGIKGYYVGKGYTVWPVIIQKEGQKSR